MELVFHYLSEYARLLIDEWMWVLLGGSLLFSIWYRNAISPLPARRASVVRR